MTQTKSSITAFLAIAVSALTLFSSAEAIAVTYSTSFSLGEDPIHENGWWIGGKSAGLAWSDFLSTPGLAFGKQPGTSQRVYDDAIALLTGTWGPDQTVQATVRTVNQNDNIFEELEIRLRSTLTANSSTGYECNFSARSSTNAYVQIVRWNGPLGNFTPLDSRSGSSMALHNGDTIACTINGSTITAYINGVQKLQVVDGTFSSGNPGIGAFLQNASGVNGDYGFTSLSASDGALPPPPPPPGTGTISLSASSYTVNEAAGSVVVSAFRSGGSSGAVGASYSTSNGTAVAGSDYTTSIGNLSWADGDATSKTFGVPIVNDGVAEANETFTVQISNPSGGATLGSPSSATVTIVDSSRITIGQTSVLTGQGSGDANTLQGIKASLGQTAMIQSMSIYFKAASGLVRLSIYDDKGNYPGTLRAQTAQFAPTAGWNTQNVTLPVTLGAGNYWLIWQTDNNSIGVAYTPGTGAYVVTGYAYGTPPAAFPSGGRSSPDESIYATLNIGGANSSPTVATPASVNPNPVSGQTTTLNVLGADDGGEANLVYTWATTGSPPAPVTFGANGTNAAKRVGATFITAGTYSLQVTIRDQGNLTATSSATVTVTPTLSAITVTPASASVATGSTQAYTATALDQFGVALAPQPAFSWTVSGGGTISAAGVFTAGSTAGGPYTINASSGGLKGTASVTVAASAPFTIGNTAVLSSSSYSDAGVLLAYKVSLARTATIQSISIYTENMGGTLYLAIYSDNGGYPGNLKAATAEFTPSSGWNKRDVTSQVSLSAGTYWLVFEPSSNSYGTGYDASGPSSGSYEAPGTYGPMPSTFRAGGRTNWYRFSLYATLL